MSETQSVPPEVAAAIVKVMGGIKTLGKEDTNKFQRYDFVSVDKFLAAVGPLCAAAGLVILQEEESTEVAAKESTDDYGKTKTSSWLTVRYAFTFVHASGAAYGPLHRSVMVPANGAQAFGSAQSYALKQFMRAHFQIPTGDKDDADHQAAEPLPSKKSPYPSKAKEAEKDTRPIGSGTEFKPPSTPFDDNVDQTDWPAYIETFKQDFVVSGSYLASQELFNKERPALKALRAARPDAYSALLEWMKVEADKLPKDAA
jgi:hypothetical protein